jgi:hypothetical protein
MKISELKILIPVSLLMNLSCGFLFEEHEETWLLEWRMYNSFTKQPITNQKVSFKILVPGGMSGMDVIDTGKIDVNGYLVNRFYTYPEDFMKKSPVLKCRLWQDTIMFIDTTFYWTELGFRGQTLDTIHNYPSSHEQETVKRLES